uniref:DDE Tnp4 domain-containing protein n=1 Tax=Romanomermis culicivorax TaxID=13658 RepID=A0A915JBC8_ROMCU
MVGRLLLLLNEERRNNIRINRIFRDRSNPLDIYNDVDLYQRYRFDRPSILHITDLLANQLNTTKRNYAMLPVQQVLMTLRYYATAGREDGFILGDSGYPCKPWLLTPFRNPENRNQLNFNAAHRRTRVIIEQTFGRWKRRFHIMHGEVRIKPSKVTKLIIATSILHNLAIDRNQRDFDDVFEDELEGIEIADYNDALGPENGKTFRLHIANSYFHL